ncbi:hypothetical protein MJG53_016648 [Ovis ammon polii x Ovis aries]|uniref:Uncharacterized protein n=1 Tax=Ovis ammon polii x Ovis aries TaxID=2918886 RepID=A0ACB9U9A3_9CETA|nr:hypothetical protein MJG53_016648 [Ovis ammon polii x Ovis aries]
MLTAEGGWGTTQGEPRTQNGGGSGGSSSENVCVPNRCVVRNELGEGKCAGIIDKSYLIRWTGSLRRSSSIMGKGDPNKPRGKMSSYAFFVQTCREEHKKKHPDSSVNFAVFQEMFREMEDHVGQGKVQVRRHGKK